MRRISRDLPLFDYPGLLFRSASATTLSQCAALRISPNCARVITVEPDSLDSLAAAMKEAMCDIKLGAGEEQNASMDKRWAELAMSLKHVDLNDLDSRAPESVRVIIRWLQAVSMTHRIALAIDAEQKPPPPDPVADKIFDMIDTNGDGKLQQNELTAYLLKEFPTRVAHTLLRVLDADMNKYVDRDEWRRGWADGLLTSILLKEHEKEENRAEDGTRARRRRSDQINALTVAVAVQNQQMAAAAAAKAAPGSGEGGKKKKKAK